MKKRVKGRLVPNGRSGYQSFLEVDGRELRLGVNVHRYFIEGRRRKLDLEGREMVTAHEIAVRHLDKDQRLPKETILLEDVLEALGEPSEEAKAMRRQR